MIPALRHAFNRDFTSEKYLSLLRLMEERCGTPVQFRLSETPCFFPKSLVDEMVQFAKN